MGISEVVNSVGKAINTGLNIGTGIGLRDIGGFGTIAAAGAIGAVAGAGSTLATDGTVNPITAAGVGGAIGLAAVPAATITAGAIGNAAIGTAKMIPGVAAEAGGMALAASPVVLGLGAKAATRAGSSIWSIGKRMINWDETADAFDKVKFTGPISGAKAGWNNSKGIKKITNGAVGAVINGKTLLGGAAVIEGTKKAWSTLQTAKMGQMTGVQTLTPKVPSYENNAGATGDLVFALNANRRG